jgi:hypothetical protein
MYKTIIRDNEGNEYIVPQSHKNTQEAIEKMQTLRHKYLVESKQIPPMTKEEWLNKCHGK